LSWQTILFLFAAGAVGGVLNAVAGGGSFIAFPALLFSGVAPVQANATNTLALWAGTTASGGAYRKRLDVARRIMAPLVIASIVGGVLGAVLLLRTPAPTFMRVLPWLMLAAVALFLVGDRVAGLHSGHLTRSTSGGALVLACLFELVVAVYGGYFGGGLGIMNLAMLAVLGMTDIHAMNALKVVLGSVINGVATVTFIASRSIAWPQAIVTTAGAVLGGFLAAHYAQRLPKSWSRAFVIVVGVAMTAYFFVKAYA
jgi:uncharacterized membrane protein YfcA